MSNTNTPIKELLGRIESPDERDKGFLMQSVIPSTPLERRWKYHWSNGWWGDQLNTPKCVAYSWLHWTSDGPRTYRGIQSPLLNPKYLYDQCQLNDQWEGTDYDGTSVRAGAKVLRSKGFIKEYRWAWDIETVSRAIIEVCPVVVGTRWTYDMFFPNENDMIEPTGMSMGGHAYVLNGINLNTGIVRLKNSWGRHWGNNGHAYMKLEHMNELIQDRGEACMAIPEINS